ncbi:hypothetical protein QDY71_02940 [Kingella negevensis]|uniref:Uncharacterized protein n=1 Tax=Kingella negevensis TaxID=1522312 RepID=A0A238HGJ1_9NEIS|nr:hypothetical protein [Kingella negevensis]MDK4679573.1 hypothetical protein [Kingella negevensis]MDK4682709.1 hypothetical protein [Kingella negevensis]MDK4685248.1 hypothetical protein [Kingella negevensis]MDK4690906.1 hypothetical protein [Kingella negevensis]MDK4693947.1 hypothetical protein [Kingella negevensis]
MWQDKQERAKELWQAYKRPVLVFAATLLIYDLLSGAKVACSRCPVPDMTPLQHFLFVFVGVESVLLPLWVYLIYARRKYEQDGYL